MVVGPSAPWLPKGTIRTESTRSLVLRESSDTTSTQCRTGGLPSVAVQISPRRGDTLWLVKVHLLRRGAQGVFEIRLFLGSLGGQPFEISGRLTLQSCPVIQPAGHFHCLVYRGSHALGPACLHHAVQVSIVPRGEIGRASC